MKKRIELNSENKKNYHELKKELIDFKEKFYRLKQEFYKLRKRVKDYASETKIETGKSSDVARDELISSLKSDEKASFEFIKTLKLDGVRTIINSLSFFVEKHKNKLLEIQKRLETLETRMEKFKHENSSQCAEIEEIIDKEKKSLVKSLENKIQRQFEERCNFNVLNSEENINGSNPTISENPFEWFNQKLLTCKNLIHKTEVSNDLKKKIYESVNNFHGNSQQIVNELQQKKPEIPKIFTDIGNLTLDERIASIFCLNLDKRVSEYKKEFFFNVAGWLKSQSDENEFIKEFISNHVLRFLQILDDASEQISESKHYFYYLNEELLKKFHLEKIKINIRKDKFNEKMHEMFYEKKSVYPCGTIIDVIETGYSYKKNTLRKAKVILSAGR